MQFELPVKHCIFTVKSIKDKTYSTCSKVLLNVRLVHTGTLHLCVILEDIKGDIKELYCRCVLLLFIVHFTVFY